MVLGMLPVSWKCHLTADLGQGSITILTLLSAHSLVFSFAKLEFPFDLPASQEPLKNLLAYELSKKHVESHPFFCHLEHHVCNKRSHGRLLHNLSKASQSLPRQEMSPILVKLCDTVLRTIDLASATPGFLNTRSSSSCEGTKGLFDTSKHDKTQLFVTLSL